MHVLTKILAVFCAVMSLVLAALSMAYATNADRIRASLEAERSLRIASEAAATAQVENIAFERTTMQDRHRAVESRADALEREVQAIRAERTQMRSELERARADADAIRNQISQLGATADTQAALIKNYREEVTRLRDELVRASKREIELVDRVNELTSQREVLEQTGRALKEQLEETRLSLQTAQSGGAATLGATQAPVARELPGPLVRASISEITDSPTGTLVVINEGTNRGLRENTQMYVIRGSDFVANIELIRVEPNSAVGRVTLTRKGMQIQRDDVVLSRLQ